MINTELKLSGLSIFEMCPLEILRELQDNAFTLTLKPRALLASSGTAAEFVYIVLYGTIKLQNQHHPHKEVIYHFLSRGDVFGAFIEPSSQNIYPCSAVAVDNCGVLTVPSVVFNKFLRRHPRALQELWVQMNDHLLELQQDRILYRRSAQSRLAEFLLRMLRKQSSVYGNRIMTKLSRRDIAAKIGTESETVVRILSEWTKNGWIRTEDKLLELLDPGSLEALL